MSDQKDKNNVRRVLLIYAIWWLSYFAVNIHHICNLVFCCGFQHVLEILEIHFPVN